MAELQRLRVQRRAREEPQHLLHPQLALQRRRAVQQLRAPVRGVAQQRVPKVPRVHTDLVGAPGLEPEAHERQVPPVEGLQHFVVRDRGLALAGPRHRHSQPVRRVPTDGGVDAAGGRVRHAPEHRDVQAARRARGELGGEAGVGAIVLGHHHHAAGAAVQAVHNAGARAPGRVSGGEAGERRGRCWAARRG